MFYECSRFFFRKKKLNQATFPPSKPSDTNITVQVPFGMSICLSVHLSICLPVSQCVTQHRIVCLPVCLSVFLSVCLCLSEWHNIVSSLNACKQPFLPTDVV